MFRFIHGYMPNSGYWNGLVKRGFITNKSGVKITQHAMSKPQEMFNAVAAVDTELYRIIKECNRPFYVDRLQGGTYFYEYDYDLSLIDCYEKLLGEGFLGFQMHEWASNYVQDWLRLSEVTDGRGIEGLSELEIIEAVKKKYPYAYIMLESQSAKEFSTQKRPQTIQEIEAALRSLFIKRTAKVKGHILPADSYFVGYGMESRNGASRFMPEVGGQIRYTRVQLAMARGVAKARGIPFGTYYEPWGGSPFSCCYYKNDYINEWGITSPDDFPFKADGANGGSSRYLQKRILFYSYLSGAEFISEEWGVCNTFYEWKDFEISPYGRVTKEFIDFTEKNPKAGAVYTPFAIVLPKGKDFFNLAWLSGQTEQYLSFKFDDETHEKIKKLASVLHIIYGTGESDFPQESGIMTNSRFGDFFDIVYEDYDGVAERYDYLIDLTGKRDFAISNPMSANRIVKAHDEDELIETIDTLIKELLPFSVEGDIHWLVNKLDEKWLLAIFNNDGIIRNTDQGEVAEHSADKKVSIRFKSDTKISFLYGESENFVPEMNCKELNITIPAGEFTILEIG